MKYAALILLLAMTAATQADGLGRLFFTPQQRAQLEHERTRDASATGGSTPSELVFNGIVQKNGGPRTVWVNGVAQDAGNSGGSPDALPVSVPGQPHPVNVKVGQKLVLERLAPASPPTSALQEKQAAADD